MPFQPTLPARGATERATLRKTQVLHFNPRSPHGERRLGSRADSPAAKISTHAPRTGSDRCSLRATRSARISTHAPRTGSDGRDGSEGGFVPVHFTPRSPHGERRLEEQASFRERKISTHAPRTGSDVFCSSFAFCPTNFNPRSPHGERPIGSYATPEEADFNPRSPHGERPRRMIFRRSSCVFQPTLPARGGTDGAQNGR